MTKSLSYFSKGTGVDYFIVKKPLNNGPYCGYTGVIKEYGSKVFIGIIDVLGHGQEAHEVAVICEDFLGKNYRRDLGKIAKGLHEHIKGSRGAVAGLCLLDRVTGELEYVCMGNITIRKFGLHNHRIIPRDGIVGYIMSTPRKDNMNLDNGDVIVLHTDGIKEHFDLEDYPELLAYDARNVATHIIEHFGKEHDDALCIVLKYSHTQMGTE